MELLTFQKSRKLESFKDSCEHMDKKGCKKEKKNIIREDSGHALTMLGMLLSLHYYKEKRGWYNQQNPPTIMKEWKIAEHVG